MTELLTLDELRDRGYSIQQYPLDIDGVRYYACRAEIVVRQTNISNNTLIELYNCVFQVDTEEEAISRVRHWGTLMDSFIAVGENALEFIPSVRDTTMFFPKEELYQWMSPQQLAQFEKLYEDCVEVAYENALGYVYSQIGGLYDIEALVKGDYVIGDGEDEVDRGTLKIIRWILSVLTAYNIASPSANHSQSLQDNYDMVVKKVTEMKTGFSTLHKAPLRKEPHAWGGVVSRRKNDFLG